MTIREIICIIIGAAFTLIATYAINWIIEIRRKREHNCQTLTVQAYREASDRLHKGD